MTSKAEFLRSTTASELHHVMDTFALVFHINTAEELLNALSTTLQDIQNEENEDVRNRFARWRREVETASFKKMAAKYFYKRASTATASVNPPAATATSSSNSRATTLTLFCIVSGEQASNAFPIKVSSTETIGEFKNAIKMGKPSAFKHIEASDLVIWRVSIPIDEDADDETIAANNIDSKRLLKATGSLSNAFKDGVPEGTIHIIVERPKGPSTFTKLGIKDVIKEVQDSFHIRGRGSDTAPQWNCRHWENALCKDTKLGTIEVKLDSEVILGLRLAYSHFFQGKYREGFGDFCYKALEHSGLFTISNVIIAIRKDLQLPDQQPLFLFLHIDEFQRIFGHHWEGTPKGRLASLPEAGINQVEPHTTEGLSLFKDMMRTLGDNMSGRIKPDMIQTFLSGTARQEVTRAAEPTSYSFEYYSCPTLSTGACYDIMNHFTKLAGVLPHQWMPKKAFLHLLSATGGLPRALQLLLEEFFGRRLEKRIDFSEILSDIDMNTDRIFNKVANALDTLYSITTFAEKYKELVRALVRLSILQKPSSRSLAPSDCFPTFTLDVLERDTHTILEDCMDNRGKVLVRIPYFFLYLYNTAIDEVRSRLASAFLHDWSGDHEWGFFERMITEYETLRSNLLISDGCRTATLGDIYKGAIGLPETLGLSVKLTKLSAKSSVHRFPESGPLSIYEQEQKVAANWKSSIVFKNAGGAQFGDVCVYRERATDSDDDILCALQAKKIGAVLSASTIQKEHEKNIKTIKKIPDGSTLDQEGIKKVRTVTILISTADMTDDAFETLKKSFPKDCLLIYEGNFKEFFGEAFSVSAALAIPKDLNWNFVTRETLMRKHKLDDPEIEQILHNMPYRSYGDLTRKLPAITLEKIRGEMGFLPYEDFQPEKRRRILDGEAEIVGLCDSGGQGITHRHISMKDFMSAHVYGGSRHKQEAVPPFYFPPEKPSGPDMVFYIRIQENIFTVFVQLKLRQGISTPDPNGAVDTISKKDIRMHVEKLDDYCPRDTYISMKLRKQMTDISLELTNTKSDLEYAREDLETLQSDLNATAFSLKEKELELPSSQELLLNNAIDESLKKSGQPIKDDVRLLLDSDRSGAITRLFSRMHLSQEKIDFVKYALCEMQDKGDERHWIMKEPLVLDVVEEQLKSSDIGPEFLEYLDQFNSILTSLGTTSSSKGETFELLVGLSLKRFNGSSIASLPFVKDIENLPRWCQDVKFKIDEMATASELGYLDGVKGDVDFLRESPYGKMLFRTTSHDQICKTDGSPNNNIEAYREDFVKFQKIDGILRIHLVLSSVHGGTSKSHVDGNDVLVYINHVNMDVFFGENIEQGNYIRILK
ncbi:hypothetical protein BGX27_002282, partial [Mortierella sp. AM989]